MSLASQISPMPLPAHHPLPPLKLSLLKSQKLPMELGPLKLSHSKIPRNSDSSKSTTSKPRIFLTLPGKRKGSHIKKIRLASSCPNPHIKKIRLILKADSDRGLYTPVSKTPNLPAKQARVRIRKRPMIANTAEWASSSKDQSIKTKFLFPENASTKEKAHIMVKWAIKSNPKLTLDYEIRALLGWGGCGSVLGAIRLSDKKEVFLFLIFLITSAP